MSALTLHMRGTFEVIREDGCDATPKGMKTRALLALLAATPGGRKGRRWLEQQLWSTRAPEQASNSLRQALAEARRVLGPAAEALGSDRRFVWLNTEHVTCVALPERGAPLEDIVISDPAFTAWKEAYVAGRSHQFAVASAPTPALTTSLPLTLQCETSVPPGTSAGVLSEMVACSVGATIAQTMHLTEVMAGAAGAEMGVKVCADIVQDGAGNMGVIKVMQPATGTLLFNQSFRFIGDASALLDSEALSKMTFEASEAVASKLPLTLGMDRPEIRAAALSQLAMHRMLSFDESAMDEAERLLEQAYEADSNGLYLAWRALLQMIRSIEDIHADVQHLQEVATELMWRAEERAGDNPMVQALCSVIRVMLFDAYEQAHHAAQRAYDASPNNPFSLQAVALVHLRQADVEKAYELSSRARTVALHSQFRHWWDIQHATVCIASGRLQEAVGSAESVLARAPKNRPMQRQLIGLYAEKNAMEKAQAQCEKLREVEPDFTLDRMLNDERYPVLTLRKSGLMEHVARLQ